MNLHFIPNNSFINNFIEIVDRISLPGHNIYFICKGDSILSKPKYDKIINKNISIAKYGTKSFYKKLGDITKYDKIFIHFLTDEMCDFVLRNATAQTKFYWLFWGADLYTPLEYFSYDVFDSNSYDYFKSKLTFASSDIRFVNFFKLAIRKLFQHSISKKQFYLRNQAIKRINFFCHYNVIDFEFMLKKHSSTARFLPFFYFEYDYSKLTIMPDTKGIKKHLKIKTKYVIQIGHSASLTNNHISIFKWLSNLSLKDVTILCPLSYGDQRYAGYIMKIGNQIFGNNFLPLTNYISKPDYLKFLSVVDVAIMNHIRTEAAGNIFMLLALGKKIYCNQKSNLYNYLINNNIALEHIDFAANPSLAKIINPLSLKLKEQNHSFIANEFSSHRAESLINNLLFI